MVRRFRHILSGLLLCVFLVGCSFPWTHKSITIASKSFTENILLGEIYAQLVENRTDIEVTRKLSLGGTPVCYTAMKNEEVDMYVEYTGTLYSEMLMHEYTPDITPDEIYEIAKKDMNDLEDIAVLLPIGMNNTFALAMQKEKADAFGIKTISNLSGAASNMVFAANSLYYARASDGYTALADKYGINFKSTAKMDNAQLYDAVTHGQADVIIVYSTDSLLEKYNMAILEDDKQFFPDYSGVPIIRNKTLKKYPELNDVLNLLADKISDERMRELNYAADVENKPPEEVAREFLETSGLLM